MRIRSAVGLSATMLFMIALGCKARNSDSGSSSSVKSDGVEDQVQPINTAEVNCSSIILKGTDRFKGSYYIMPRALLAINKTGERLFAITKKADGKYLLQFGLYFPSSFDKLNLRGGDLILNGCDTIAVQNYINAHADADFKVRFFGMLPAQHITVKIAGIEAPFRFGTEEDGIYNYEGLDNLAEFELDEGQMHDTVSRITSGVGLEVSVGFDFQARRTDGYADATIDSTDVMNALDASLQGQIQVVDIDLKGKLQMLMATKKINVYTEGKLDDTAFGEISKKLMDAVVAEDPSLETEATANSTANDQPKPAEGGAGVVDAVAGATKLFKVKALMQHLSKGKKYQISYKKMGDNSVVKYRTSAVLKGSLSESDVEKFDLASGDEAKTFSVPIVKGDRFILAPVDVQEFDQKFAKTKTYFDTQKLNAVRDKLTFEQLGWSRSVYEYTAQNAKARAYIWDGWKASVFNYKFYVWGETDAFVSQKLPKTQQPTVAEYKTTPVAVSFARLPQRSLAKLADGIPGYLSAKVDGEGRIEIEALQDLGKMQLINNAQYPAAPASAFPDGVATTFKTEYFQEKLATFSDSIQEHKTDASLSKQGIFPQTSSLVNLNVVTLQLAKDKVPLIKLEKTKNEDSSAMVF